MQTKEDLRIIKTKRKLFDTFMLLLEHNLYDEITVNELCSKANVRRATFYKHFSDKLDFATYAIRRLRDSFDEYVWKKENAGYTAEYYTAYAGAAVEYFDSNEAIVNNILNAPSAGEILSLIVTVNQNDTMLRLEESLALGLVLPSSANVVASMLIGGACSILYSWLKDNKKLNKDDLKENLCSCICAVFK
jgi:AcrR family transcriptional regulator